jgi:hypothetical protein
LPEAEQLLPPAVGAPARPAELPNIPVNSNYRRSRLADSTAGPLNEQRMRSAMQQQQIPKVANISAQLQAGSRAGFNLL